ncbi:artemin-like [Pithys albifrons albifrons]|uniref:artemin-like n=1 Tax=Pithys albifrons albifrons TaxID=3385563 RepID=UPI003A5D0FC0
MAPSKGNSSPALCTGPGRCCGQGAAPTALPFPSARVPPPLPLPLPPLPPGAPRAAPPPRSNVARARPPPPPIGRAPRQSRAARAAAGGPGGRSRGAGGSDAAGAAGTGRAGPAVPALRCPPRRGKRGGEGERYMPAGRRRRPLRAPLSRTFSLGLGQVPPPRSAAIFVATLATSEADSPRHCGRGEPASASGGPLRPGGAGGARLAAPSHPPAPLASPRRGRVPGPGRARRRRQRRLPPSRP